MDFELCDAVVLVEVDWLKQWVDLWFTGFDLGWFPMGFGVRIWYGFWFRNGFRDGFFSFWFRFCGFCVDFALIFFVGFVHGGGGSESPQSTFSLPSWISSLKNSQTPMHKLLIAASTFSGSSTSSLPTPSTPRSSSSAQSPWRSHMLGLCLCRCEGQWGWVRDNGGAEVGSGLPPISHRSVGLYKVGGFKISGFVYGFLEFGFEIYGFDVCIKGLIFHVMFWVC